MFKYAINPGQNRVPVTLDNSRVMLPLGANLAAALLGMGELIFRFSPVSGKPSSPHCLMGVCYECLMEINGVTRQACMTRVEEGMVINRHREPLAPLQNPDSKQNPASEQDRASEQGRVP
jgi:predicted molibdopterin-dependent oxidoreductase YjgC